MTIAEIMSEVEAARLREKFDRLERLYLDSYPLPPSLWAQDSPYPFLVDYSIVEVGSFIRQGKEAFALLESGAISLDSFKQLNHIYR